MRFVKFLVRNWKDVIFHVLMADIIGISLFIIFLNTSIIPRKIEWIAGIPLFIYFCYFVLAFIFAKVHFNKKYLLEKRKMQKLSTFLKESDLEISSSLFLVKKIQLPDTHIMYEIEDEQRKDLVIISINPDKEMKVQLQSPFWKNYLSKEFQDVILPLEQCIDNKKQLISN